MKKQMLFKTKGMNRDLSVSAFNPEFAFENMNLRLSTNEGNTMMSWVNEKGTQQLNISEIKDVLGTDKTSEGIHGIPIGTAVLNHKLVLFTTESDSSYNYIYVFEYTNDIKTSMSGKLLYKGNLGMDTKHPLETLVSYEIDNEVEKVYWTDGKNQPRMINIAADANKIQKWNEYSFDFVPAFEMKDSVTVTKNVIGGGFFSPGVIQYAFSYLNKYGQQSNLVYVSPLQYIAHSTRGASPEEKVSNSFEIKINNIDNSFDYIRLYSIQRTSLNGEVFAKHLEDIPINNIATKTQFKINLVYSEDSTYTLPRDNKGKILKATVTGGTYSVTVPSYTIYGYDFENNRPVSNEGAFFSHEADIKFVYYINTSDDARQHTIISLQELIDRLQANDGFIAEQGIEYYNKDFHSEFYVTSALNSTLIALAKEKAGSDNAKYGLKVDNTIYWGDPANNGFLNLYFSYTYGIVTSWYITNSALTDSIEKDDDTEFNDITYIDNGTTGSSIDPNELFFIGGKEISALTMTDKDNKLFLGNIEEKNILVTAIQEYFDSIRGSMDDEMQINFINNGTEKQLTLDSPCSFYDYTNMLKWNQREMTTFKGGETYRFGFQFQKKTGEWTEPIFIDDFTNDKYPNTGLYNDTVYLVHAVATLSLTNISTYLNANGFEAFDYSTFKKVRPVIVYPSIADRTVICQGVLNPTVFNVEDRPDNSPYAQASWFFRPYMCGAEGSGPATIDLNNKISITSSDNPIDADTIDPYFNNSDLLNYVWVLIADVNIDETDETYRQNNPLETGKILVRITHVIRYVDGYPDEVLYYRDVWINYWGIICLETNDNVKKYAFISPELFIAQSDIITEDTSTSSSDRSKNYVTDVYKYQNVEYVAVSNRTFKCYKGLITQNQELYYFQPFGAPDSYTFNFYANDSNTTDGKYWSVEFSAVGTASEFDPVTGTPSNVEGSELRYRHYDSIFAQSEVSVRDTNPSYHIQARQVEIQGSKNIYDNVFDLTKNTEKYVNSQFFIDQSIVTLNSPDLEFDTDVQNYKAEGLALRIIGAIPLTSNVSAHHIDTSSSLVISGLNTTHPGTPGSGERDINVTHYNISNYGGRRLVSELLWNDVAFIQTNEQSSDETNDITGGIADATDNAQIIDAMFKQAFEQGYYTSLSPVNFYVHPWQKWGPMGNDAWQSSATLRTKKMSELLYSFNTEYFSNTETSMSLFDENNRLIKNFEDISYQPMLSTAAVVTMTKLPKQKKTSSEIIYYANQYKNLYNEGRYKPLGESPGGPFTAGAALNWGVGLSYNSNTHAVIALNASSSTDEKANIPLLPSVIDNDSEGRATPYGAYYNPVSENDYTTFWGDTKMTFDTSSIDVARLFKHNGTHQKHDLLWLGEVYRPNVPVKFGGKTDAAVATNKWLVAGDAVDLTDAGGDGLSSVTLKWTTGDTYYQRYDCLKTFAWSPAESNQIVEILSFMCETHVNLDGMYDKNRGDQNNIDKNPSNMHYLNPVYSQMDNFFVSRKIDSKGMEKLTYPNQLTYTRNKEAGADVDLWTNITLANTLELDGDKGSINKLTRLNDQIICFQDSGISHILYNENVQISSTNGVPIEIANSDSVRGKKYLSDSIGCSNKWSVVNTPAGIYFMDSNDKSIYLFNGELQNVSLKGGMSSWCKQNIPATSIKWNPSDFNNFVAYYDKMNQEVLWINKDTALAFSERLGVFTSFYDYGNTPFFCNLDDTGIWINKSNSFVLDPNFHLWKHRAGEYCEFFNRKEPYWMTLVGNPEPQTDKIFTNLEFRANVDTDGTVDNETGKFTPILPFTSLEVWNEYQHGKTSLEYKTGHDAFRHYDTDSTSSLQRKFRIWRCDIPRNNYVFMTYPERRHLEPISQYEQRVAAYNEWLSGEHSKGIFRYGRKPNDRMRNPWLYLRLMQKANEVQGRTEIHDVMMTYFD